MNHFPRFEDYQNLDPEGMNRVIDLAKSKIESLLSDSQTKVGSVSARTLFLEVLVPVFDIQEWVSYPWTLVGHLKNVLGKKEIRNYYEANLSIVNDFFTGLSQDERIYKVCQSIKENDFSSLTHTEQKIVNDLMLDFKLSGVLLDAEKKDRYKKLVEEVMVISNKFSKNVVEDTDEFEWFFPDDQELQGMPEGVLERAHLAAVRAKKCQANETGYLFNLKPSSYIDFMTYQPNRALRQKLSEAYITRASKGERDNTPLIDEILSKRQEIAELLGFSTYSDVVLQKHLVKDPNEIFDFLFELLEQSVAVANEEKNELEALFNQDQGSTEQPQTIQNHDIGYYTEKLKKAKYDFSGEEVKKYFPHTKVIDGLFAILEKIFGYKLEPQPLVKGWHESVWFYQVTKDNQPIGYIYFDLFARDGKNGGAWMDVHQSRKRIHQFPFQKELNSVALFGAGEGSKVVNDNHPNSETIQLPIAYMVCNYSPPNEFGVSLLSHRDVETIFHEMGHVLHHLLTDEEYLPVSGISKVPWDGVELPSQFLENWAWDYESIQMLSEHEDTKEVLPKELFEKMLRGKNLNAGLQMLNQLEYALFDMELHAHYLEHKKSGKTVQDIIDDVRKKVSIIPYPAYNKFQNLFTHIFDGGYASGYYSYKWAEVMSADAFSLFIKNGIFNSELGKKFRDTILARGGSKDFKELYIDFKGEMPTVDALLEQRGLKVS